MKHSITQLFSQLLLFTFLLSGCASSGSAIPTSSETTMSAALEETIPETTQVTAPIETIPLHETVTVNGITYDAVFGEPLLDHQQIKSLVNAGNQTASADTITSVGDALAYMAERHKVSRAADDCDLFEALLKDDYEQVNQIHFYYDGLAYDTEFCMVYVLYDGLYYAFDPFHPLDNWVYLPENDCSYDTDLNVLAEKLIAAMPYKGEHLDGIKIVRDLDAKFAEDYAAFGDPLLGREEVRKLSGKQQAAEAITHVADAFYYLEKNPPRTPRDMCMEFVDLLEGNYESLGTIQIRSEDGNNYLLAYVELDGIYYAFDPFTPFSRDIIQPGAEWIYLPENDCLSSTDLLQLVNKLADAFPYFDASRVPVEFSMDIRKRLELYCPELGTATLTPERISELYRSENPRDAAKAVTNVADAFAYLAEHGKFTSPANACDFFGSLILDDYDSLGKFEMIYSEKGYGNISKYFTAYVEQDGMYYAFDPFRADSNWIFIPEYECFRNPDLNLLGQRLGNVFPHTNGTLEEVRITPFGHGADEYYYLTTSIPVGLGQPKLSDEEIDTLIAEGDFETIAQTVNTLPDAVNYIIRAGITYDNERINNIIGGMNYCYSAWQIMKSGIGQCTMFSNLMHYLLEGDYDEVGYVGVRSPGDGHVMVYILENGLYYLIDPSQYGTPTPSYWLGYYSGLLGCAEDFRDIADSLTENFTLGDKKYVNQVHLVKSPGDFVDGKGGRYYPVGTEVIPYHGVTNITYQEAGYEWDTQTRIDY